MSWLDGCSAAKIRSRSNSTPARCRVATCLQLVEELPRIGAVEAANPRSRDDRGIHEPRVDAHALERRIEGRPVRRTSARLAVMGFERLVAPAIPGSRA